MLGAVASDSFLMYTQRCGFIVINKIFFQMALQVQTLRTFTESKRQEVPRYHLASFLSLISELALQ